MSAPTSQFIMESQSRRGRLPTSTFRVEPLMPNEDGIMLVVFVEGDGLRVSQIARRVIHGSSLMKTRRVDNRNVIRRKAHPDMHIIRSIRTPKREGEVVIRGWLKGVFWEGL